ncbi:MAG: hypothetical protein GF308_02255 [Candidatus Heimdallarchaeota archaeon]|nr:hypothetical protein [Candidatus Heimdallarchaeota archaeon]
MEEFAEYFEIVLKKAKSLCSEMLVVSMFPIDENRTQPFKENIFFCTKDFWQLYKQQKQGDLLKNQVEFLDTFKKKIPQNKNLLSFNRGHLNEKGHELLFKIVKNHLEKKG